MCQHANWWRYCVMIRNEALMTSWRHQMETFSALLAICAGNSPVPVNSPHKGQWRGALMFSLICARINGWVNNGKAGDLIRNRAHYDVTVIPYYRQLVPPIHTASFHIHLMMSYLGHAYYIDDVECVMVSQIASKLIVRATASKLRIIDSCEGNPPVTITFSLRRNEKLCKYI